MPLPLSKTVGLPVPAPSFPLEDYDIVNQRMSHVTSVTAQKSAWHSFAAAWNAVAYRLIGAHRHAESLRDLISRPVGSSEERLHQDHELFCWAVAAQSAIECAYFAAQILAAVGIGQPFAPARDADLRWTMKDIAQYVAKLWPCERISDVLRRHSEAPEFRRLSDLRRVLFHRGTLPRMIFASTAPGATLFDAIPSNPAEPADQWRYQIDVRPSMTDAPQQWCDAAVAEIISALGEFTANWKLPP